MDTKKEAFESLRATLMEIDPSRFVRRNRKVEYVSGETKSLIVAALADRRKFLDIPRFDISLIDTLELRLLAWEYCQSECESTELLKAKSESDWLSFSQPAKELKKRFIRRRKVLAEEENDVAVLEELKTIAGGKGKERLMRDFSSMIEMIERDRTKIAAIGLDDLFVKMAINSEKTLARILKEHATPDEKKRELADMVNRSYTYLAEAILEICKYGRMIFDGTPRERLYISERLRELSRRKMKTKSDSEE